MTAELSIDVKVDMGTWGWRGHVAAALYWLADKILMTGVVVGPGAK